MDDKAVLALIERVHSGQFKVTQANYKKALDAFSKFYYFECIFEELGFAWLPDPEQMYGEGLESLEGWIVEARTLRGEERSDAQQRMDKLKAHIRLQVQTEAGRVQ